MSHIKQRYIEEIKLNRAKSQCFKKTSKIPKPLATDKK